jgi:calcineurin-like phosphoesterase family protein
MIRLSGARLAALGAAVVLCTGSTTPAAAPTSGSLPCDLTTTERIVAVGDVHGAYDRFIAVLRAAGLIDSRERWTGGRAVFIQTGDVVDRGTDSRRALDLLRRLEREAQRAGGRVVPLLGNHEVMGMLGDLRYVSAGEYAAFRSPDSLDLRERYYRLAADDAAARARAAGRRFDEAAFRAEFLDATPLGSLELRLAFARDGEYGRWLRERHTAIRINDIVFVHGGISATTAVLGCSRLNDIVRSELKALPVRDPAELATFLITKDDGPLWYRGLALENEDIFSAEVDRILELWQAHTIVVGHTATGGRITARFGGRVVQIDTGMLGGDFFADGRASALEISEGRFTAIYEDGREDLPIRRAAKAAVKSVTPFPSLRLAAAH